MIVYKALLHLRGGTFHGGGDHLWSIYTPIPLDLEYKPGEITHAHPDTELFVFDTLEHAVALVATSETSDHEIWSAETDTVHKLEFISGTRFHTVDDLRAWWKSERQGEFPVPLGTLTTPSLRLLERVK